MKNKRDLIVVIIAILTIVACIVLAYRLLNPSPKSSADTNAPVNKDAQYVNPNIDDNTYTDLQNLSFYPKPALDNIGKTDIFAK